MIITLYNFTQGYLQPRKWLKQSFVSRFSNIFVISHNSIDVGLNLPRKSTQRKQVLRTALIFPRQISVLVVIYSQSLYKATRYKFSRRCLIIIQFRLFMILLILLILFLTIVDYLFYPIRCGSSAIRQYR